MSDNGKEGTSPDKNNRIPLFIFSSNVYLRVEFQCSRNKVNGTARIFFVPFGIRRMLNFNFRKPWTLN